MSAGTVAIGDELIVMQKHSCYKTTVASIQIEQSPHEQLDVRDGQEIGLGLSARANQGAELLRIASAQPTAAGTLPEPISPDDFPIQITPNGKGHTHF
jgi:hypothetical protein